MKAKKNTLNATINNLDEKLAEMLPQYEVVDYETRDRMKGGNSLYIRMRRLHQPTMLALAND